MRWLFCVWIAMFCLGGCEEPDEGAEPETEAQTDAKPATTQPGATPGQPARGEPDGGAEPDAKAETDTKPATTQPGATPGQPAGGMPARAGEPQAAALYTSALDRPVPFLLYPDGLACLDANVVTTGIDAATHRAQNPDQWTHWRRNGGVLETQDERGAWKAKRPDEIAPLAKDSRLRAALLYENGVEVGSGGYYERMRYLLLADGRFRSCFRATGFATGVVSGKKLGKRKGTYQIDGFVVRLTHEDGEKQTLSFVYSPTLKQAWVDKDWFTLETSDEMAVGAIDTLSTVDGLDEEYGVCKGFD